MSNYADKFNIMGEDILLKDSDARNSITQLTNLINKSVAGGTSNVYTVGHSGAMFTSIIDAVNKAKTDIPQLSASNSNPILCTIVIYAGTYDGGLDLGATSGICFLGLGGVYWTSSSPYPIGCATGYGTNHFYNINFSTTGTTAYAYHYEGGGYNHSGLSTNTKFVLCNFTASDNAGVGIGGANQYTNIEFYHCAFGGKDRALYIHNSTWDGSANNYIRLYDCVAGVVRIEDAAHINADRRSVLGLIFTGNSFLRMNFYGGNMGAWANVEQGSIPINHTNIIMSPESYGNVGVGFNYDTRRVQIEGFYVKGAKGNWDSYAYNIPVDRCNEYNWNLYQAVASDGTNISGNCTVIVNSGNNNITIKDSSSVGVNGLTNIVIIGTPKIS